MGRVLRRARERIDGPMDYRIDAEGIRTTGRHFDGVVRWPLIDRFEQQPDLLLIRLGSRDLILVPVGELAAPGRRWSPS